MRERVTSKEEAVELAMQTIFPFEREFHESLMVYDGVKLPVVFNVIEVSCGWICFYRSLFPPASIEPEPEWKLLMVNRFSGNVTGFGKWRLPTYEAAVRYYISQLSAEEQQAAKAYQDKDLDSPIQFDPPVLLLGNSLIYSDLENVEIEVKFAAGFCHLLRAEPCVPTAPSHIPVSVEANHEPDTTLPLPVLLPGNHDVIQVLPLHIQWQTNQMLVRYKVVFDTEGLAQSNIRMNNFSPFDYQVLSDLFFDVPINISESIGNVLQDHWLHIEGTLKRPGEQH